MKTKKPLLTISLLISNRPDTIPKCLDSLKPIMEAVPSELILIDTSKSEEIHNLLLTYTDQVYEFEWCKDFAKARNEGVRRAKGQWFMFLDDDEWFVESQEIIDFFQSGKYKKCEYAHIIVRNFMDVEYTVYSDGWCTRLFYIGGGAEFRGKVHEYIHNIHGEPTYLQAIAYHSGYVFDTEEKRRAHFERNKQILDEAIEENPNDLRLIAHLVQEYRSVKDWDAMVDLCKRRITETKVVETCSEQNHFCTLYAGLVEALTFLEKRKQALEICKLGLEDVRSTDLLKYLLHMYSAMNYTELKKWDKANFHIRKYFDGYEHFQKNKDTMNVQLGAALIHRVFDNDYMSRASNMLVYSSLKKDHIEIPLAIAGEEEKKEMDIDKVLEYVKAMIDLIVATKHKGVFTDFLNHTVRNAELCKLMCSQARKLENEDEEAFQRVAYEFSKLDSDFWYIYYCRVIVADAENDKAAVQDELEKLLQVFSNVFYMPDKVYDIVDKYEIKIATLWDRFAGKNWMNQIKAFAEQCQDAYIDKAYDYIVDVYGQEDWRAESLPVALVEKQIGIGMNDNVLDYHNLLCDYAERKLICYYYFSEELGVETELPAEVRAAAKIKDYAETEAVDVKKALRYLMEVAEICPSFANGIRQFFQFYPELERQRVTRQREEMRALRTEAMNEVSDLMKKGQTEAAMQLVEQLKQIFPEDLEVISLGLELRLQMLEK